MAVWYYAVAEALHDLQNPTSPEKVLAAGRAANLGPGSRVLDLAGGKGGPAALLARELGCAVTLVERAPEFAAAARAREGARIEVVEGDAAAFHAEPGTFDAVLCLGASFIWGGLEGTLAAIIPAARPGGSVLVGEPYFRRLPLPQGYPEYDEAEGSYTSLAGTAEKVASQGLALVAVVTSSEDDWDRYESLHWKAVEEWAVANPDHPDRNAVHGRMSEWRELYLRWEREYLGWAIFVARKPG